MSLIHQGLILRKEPRSYQRLRTMVHDILEQQQQHVDLSKKGAEETQQQQHPLRKELKREAKIVDLGHQKARAREAENVLSNMTRRRKAKGNQSRSLVKRDNSADRQNTRKTGRSPSGKEDRPPCFNCKKGNCCHDRECDCWHPSHCKYFKKDQCELVRPQAKERSTCPASDKEQASVAIVKFLARVELEDGPFWFVDVLPLSRPVHTIGFDVSSVLSCFLGSETRTCHVLEHAKCTGGWAAMHLGAAMLYRFQPSPLLFVMGSACSPRAWPWLAGRDDRAALVVFTAALCCFNNELKGVRCLYYTMAIVLGLWS